MRLGFKESGLAWFQLAAGKCLKLIHGFILFHLQGDGGKQHNTPTLVHSSPKKPKSQTPSSLRRRLHRTLSWRMAGVVHMQQAPRGQFTVATAKPRATTHPQVALDKTGLVFRGLCWRQHPFRNSWEKGVVVSSYMAPKKGV